jgi:hypothetical protein
MKAIHGIITFLAALVVLAFAGWQTYLHWDMVTGKHTMSKCACVADCKCVKCDCKAGKKCIAACTCAKCKCNIDCKCEKCVCTHDSKCNEACKCAKCCSKE